jgi:hypothetical protein
MGRKSSFKTSMSKGAAGGVTALDDRSIWEGEASMGCKQRTTEMHSNVLINSALRATM